MLLSFSFAGLWLYMSLRGDAIILPGIKKARLTVLDSCLLNSSIYTPFLGLFFVDFFRNFQEKPRQLNTIMFLEKSVLSRAKLF